MTTMRTTMNGGPTMAKRPFQIQILAGSMPPVRSLMGPEMPAYMVDRAGRRQ